MSDLDSLQDAFLKADALAQQGDAQAKEDAAMFASEIRRIQAGGEVQAEQGEGLMAHVNKGIASSVGGLVDLVNPFDQPHGLNPFPEGTGSARTGLEGLMRNSGISVAEGDPETLPEALARGSGEAAGAMVPVAGAAQRVRSVGGIIGSMADDIYRGMASGAGMAAEVAGGAVSEGGRMMARDAGAPEWAQNAAALAAPAAIPTAYYAAKGAVDLAGRMPVGRALRAGSDAVVSAVAPYTKSGAQAVASGRVRALAGGDDRAARLAREVSDDNPLGLTPAQQTNDPNMIALEQLAVDQSPNMRDALDARAAASRRAAADELRAGAGGAEDAQRFFQERRLAYADELRARVDDIVQREQAGVDAISAQRDPSENSLGVMREIDSALDAAKVEEKSLWDAVPKGQIVGTGNAKATAARWQEELGPVGRDDIPEKAVRFLLDENDVFSETATVRDMHRLYSSLRETARNARAGNNVQRTLAKVADEIADSILEDFKDSGVRSIDEARAFSAALHETFDQGAVGRVLKRTTDGDTATSPELSLERTVGRGGTQAAVASREIEAASDQASPYIQDYLKGQFSRSASDPNGQFTQARAARFIRDNKELLDRYPGIRDDIKEAVAGRESADRLAQRVEKRITSLANAKKSATAAFLDVSPEKAFNAVTGAKNPIRAARLLASEARKDASGAAMAGLKDAFSNHLISGGVTGESLAAKLADPKIKGALRQIYSEAEMARFGRIAREVGKLDAAQAASPSVGDSLSGARANKLVEFALRIVAANRGAQLGEGASSLQTAQMASGRAKDIVNRLASDRASQLIADAIQDPELFRALLLNTKSPGFDKKVTPLLLPYLMGGGSAAASE